MGLIHLVNSALRRQSSFYLLWIISLSLAVIGLVSVDVFRFSLSDMVKRQGRKILSADISVSARRKLTGDEKEKFLKIVGPSSTTSEVMEMVAMVSSKTDSRLALVRFVDERYPLIGELRSEEQPVNGQTLAQGPQALVAADLLPLLQTAKGESLKIGELPVQLSAVIQKDSSQTVRFGAMVPRLYISARYLGDTKLVQFGSTVTNTLLATSAKSSSELKAELEKAFADPAIEVTEPKDIEQGSLRALSRILDFLGLIGLVTLSLGWVGVYYLGRRWLTFERPSLGVLKCLGYLPHQITRLLMIKLLLVLGIGVGSGAALSWWLTQLLYPFVRNALPEEFVIVWSWPNTALLLAIGPLCGWLLMFGPILELSRKNAYSLLNPEDNESQASQWVGRAFNVLTIALLFTVLTWLQARSWKITGIFFVSLLGCFALFAGSSLGLIRWCRMQRDRLTRDRFQSVAWHLASAHWVRRPSVTILIVTISALSALLAQMVPHLEASLIGEINSPTTALERPSLFLIDIQDEQLEPLKSWLNSNKITISESSPFIRARLLKVNEQDYERMKTDEWSTREQEMDARMRNRGVNLSYRKRLNASESILSGINWDKMRLEPADISVEQGYAERMDLHLGDKLTFDIQGVEMMAQIASLRKVDWDSFEPNFFIQFPDGVLNEAPKTWIVTVKQSPILSATEIQRGLAASFPNVTSLNVAQTVDTITQLVRKVSQGLNWASRLALALGLFVFLMVLIFQLVSTERDWRQLEIMGLNEVQIWRVQALTYVFMVLIGNSLGAALSFAATFAVAHFAFASQPQWNFPSAMFIFALSSAASLLGLSIVSWMQAKKRARSVDIVLN